MVVLGAQCCHSTYWFVCVQYSIDFLSSDMAVSYDLLDNGSIPGGIENVEYDECNE